MNSCFIRLLQALDPLFPIGAFTVSNGMETYTQKEIVRDKESLSRFLNGYIYTLPTNDLGIAAKAAEGHSFAELDEICAAAKSPRELRGGSMKLCRRFIKTELALNDYAHLKNYSDEISAGNCAGFHCIAVGLFIADLKVNISEGLGAYCYSLLSSAANHAVKLVPLGQLDGQKALSEVMEKIPEAVLRAVETDIADLGISGAGFDMRSMQHEKLYSRIYIS